LPELPDDIVVVPIPTIAPHVRIRGYGHTELIAKQIAHTRKLAYRPVLQRRTNPVQHGATKQQRALQAAGTFECMSLDGGRYLLVDDVYTTGETLKHAARCLKKAGATEVWTTVISRQPLEK
jgi:competence protein ComFC